MVLMLVCVVEEGYDKEHKYHIWVSLGRLNMVVMISMTYFITYEHHDHFLYSIVIGCLKGLRYNSLT